jgi:hypothetical protein
MLILHRSSAGEETAEHGPVGQGARKHSTYVISHTSEASTITTALQWLVQLLKSKLHYQINVTYKQNVRTRRHENKYKKRGETWKCDYIVF